MTLLGGGGTALDEAGKRPTAARLRPGMRWDCSWRGKGRRKNVSYLDGIHRSHGWPWLNQEGKDPEDETQVEK